MREELTSRVDIGVAGVDVSNACRDQRLPGRVGLHRLDLVLDAWRAQLCRHTEFHFVADRSLLGDLSREDKQRAKLMRRAGKLRVSLKKADAMLLDDTEAHGGCVLSRDRFLDARGGRTWVPERFFTWTVSDGEVRIARQESRNTQPFDVSRKLEQKLAQARGFPGLAHPAARRRWACVSGVDCITRESTPEALQVLPVLKGGIALCPGCGQPLDDLGIRPSEAELKLVVDEVALARFTVRQGDMVAFGRLILPNTVKLAEMARKGVFAGLGRKHADLRMAGKRVAVRPVDDRHQVGVRRWDPQRRRFERQRELRHADGFSTIGLRDTLLLGDRLELVRSGRSIAEAEELLEGSDGAAWRLRRTADQK